MEVVEGWYNSIYETIWQDRLWLPHGVYFKDLLDQPGFIYPKPRDLVYMPLFGICLHIIRLVFERLIAFPLATRLGIKDHDAEKKIMKNSTLESFYVICRHPSKDDILSLSKQNDLSVKEVQRWFRRRRNCDRPSLRKKFAESSWRFCLYLFAYTFGMVLLFQSPWFWDNLECWIDYPRQSMSNGVYFYYMFEGTMYMSLAFALMRDIKRKDFTEQIIHHFATLFLIWFSYCSNFVRIGTLVMAIHDISDIFLEFAKSIVYTQKWQKVADLLFICFSTIFIISRLVFFPFWIIHTTLIKSMWLYKPYFGYYFFNGLLFVLQLLHIFWAAIILKMAYKMVIAGKVEKDDRSDVEEQSSEEEEEQKPKKKASLRKRK